MDKEQLLLQLMPMFLGELDEHLRTLNRDVLALENAPSAARRVELLQTIFRAVHSLKGAARSVGVQGVAKACHQIEDLLSPVRDGARPLAPAAFSLLFEALDAFSHAGDRLRQNKPVSDEVFVALGEKLSRAAAPQDAPPTAVEAETPPPPVASPPPRSAAPAPAAAQRPMTLPEKKPERLTSRSGTVRVGEEKLDLLLAQTGELLVARQRMATRPGRLSELQEHVALLKAECRAAGQTPKLEERLRNLERDLEFLTREMVADSRELNHACRAVDNEVHRIRMLPFAQGSMGLERAVRDLSRGTGKEVSLVIEGGEIELDRAVLEGLSDPLLHLVRNSVDHGLEPPAERLAAGKPAQGQITVSVALRGSLVEVVVADDGRGLDLEKIRAKAKAANQPDAADDRELARRIFLPGFSTAAIITDVSGRGVGLDVVRERVEGLRGTIEVSTEAGQGTRFVLTLPLTLTTIAAILVEAGGQVFAVACTNVNRLVRFGLAELARLQGQDVLRLGAAPLPVFSLAETLGLAPREPRRESEQALGMVLTTGGREAVFVVDELLAEQELVIKNLGPRIRRLRHVSGATLLPSGRIALVLSAANLIRDALGRGAPGAGRTFASDAPAAKKRLLTVDDSVTTRNLLRIILEAAGYDVTVAIDGQDAWQKLQDDAFDLVVSDIEMPRLDGFELTKRVRGSHRLAALPVVLVTGRETDEDKLRGIESGANAYLVKSAFDQRNLLETIAQLL